MTEPKEGEKVYYSEGGRYFFRDGCLFMKTIEDDFDDHVFFAKGEDNKWRCYSDHPGYFPILCDRNSNPGGDIPPVNGWNDDEPGFFRKTLEDFHLIYHSQQ